MEEKKVIVVDVQIPFWSLVSLIVKATIAVIPAVIILSALVFIIVAVATRVSGSPN